MNNQTSNYLKTYTARAEGQWSYLYLQPYLLLTSNLHGWKKYSCANMKNMPLDLLSVYPSRYPDSKLSIYITLYLGSALNFKKSTQKNHLEYIYIFSELKKSWYTIFSNFHTLWRNPICSLRSLKQCSRNIACLFILWNSPNFQY